jgi:hypothetical protein
MKRFAPLVFLWLLLMHLSILIPGGKGAGNGWGFDKKIKNLVKCPLVGHSKIIKCFKTDAPRG